MKRGKQKKGAVLTVVVLWLVFAAFYVSGSFEKAENILYDALYNPVPEAPSADARIVIVGVDDSSIERLGQWPWPRGKMAALLDILAEGGAAAVGIDILYDTPDHSPDGDALLGGAIERAENVVLAVSSPASTFDRKKRTASGVFEADRLIVPIETLRSARLGHVNGLPEGDGIMRRAQLCFYHRDKLYNSLAYELYDIYTGGMANAIDIPTDPAGRYYIKFTATSGYYYHISFADVLEGKVPARYFKDKLVLVGVYAAEGLAGDWQYTSIDSHHPTYGVEIHANLLQQLLEGKFIRDLPLGLDIGVFLLFSLAAAFLFIRQKPKTGLVWLAVLLFCHAGVLYAAVKTGYVMQMLYAPAFCLVAYVAALVWHYIQTKMEEARIRGTFGRYMAPSVIKKILDEGEEGLKLGGQRLDVTVLFADIRGFTPLSESVRPEEAVQILNEYLDLAAGCIHKYGGTLDKFIGDAAMAIWGAPYPMAGHTKAALDAALELRARSEEQNRRVEEKYGKTVRFGIGINAGEAVIGNIGSVFRMDYTAIGDTVNTAARLESNAKPGQILVSKAAADNLVGENDKLNFLGGLKVKGKEEEVLVYEALL